MKKTIIFVMTLMSVVSAVAQTDEPRNEIGISYGVGVSLLGLEAGSQHVRAFVEAGFGEQGIVLAGLKYRF